MGTNFYWQDGEHKGIHIGKRSAAGAYCWTCRLSLCYDGEAHVHTGKSRWAEACWSCGTPVSASGAIPHAVAIELGFSREPNPRVGVASCSSFTWASEPDDVLARCAEPDARIVDEYDCRYDGAAFLAMLENCPIRFTDHIGEEFC